MEPQEAKQQIGHECNSQYDRAALYHEVWEYFYLKKQCVIT